MSKQVIFIPWISILISLIPMLIVVVVQYLWKTEQHRTTLYGISRMVGQLILVGYFLTYLFSSENIWLLQLVFVVMLSVASWIIFRPIPQRRREFVSYVWIALGGSSLLMVMVLIFIIHPNPWYKPAFLIPTSGMIFSNSMNATSIALERFFQELESGKNWIEARVIALKTGLIPFTNSLFAVGIVSLPGLMTGQILVGTDPLIAVRYQIVLFGVLFGAAGMTIIGSLLLIGKFKLKAI
jgi:putative ABC transport system permease protein